MVAVIDIEPIRERFSAVAPFLDERGRRLVAGAEAFAAGYGGIAAVAMATGVAPSTIGRGLKELAQDEPPASARAGSPPRIRRPGAGRQRTISKDPRLLRDLEALVEPTTRGDPQSPLRWGPARACATWRRRCKRRVTRSAAPWSPTCSVSRVIVCKPTARPRRATATRTAMRSSATSTPK